MLPIYLKMKNFLSYESEEFDFSKITCATVTGKNGAGKSSFCTDAITFALYGIGSKGGIKELDNYVRKGADSGTVEFTFSLGDDRYKVIRTRSVTRGKTSLAFFTLNDGLEIPLGDGKVNHTQELIESTIHMNYRTFVSTAMVAQGKSSMFTEGMTDNERKEALIDIMDIDSWGTIGEEVSEQVRNLKADIRSINSLIENTAIPDTAGLEKQKKDIEKELAAVSASLLEQKELLDANKETMFLSKNLNEQKQETEGSLKDQQEQLAQKQSQKERLLQKAEAEEQAVAALKKQQDDLEEIVSRKDSIESAFQAFHESEEKLKALEAKQVEILKKAQEIQSIIQQGKDWNAFFQNESRQLDIHIENCKKQAEALNSVPCSDNEKFVSSCRFLKMAREAKESLAVYKAKKEELLSKTNPYRDAYVAMSEEYRKLQDGFSDDKLAEAKRENEQCKDAEADKRMLDEAVSKKQILSESISMKKANIEDKKEQANKLTQESSKISETIENLKIKVKDIAGKIASLSESTDKYTAIQSRVDALETKKSSLEQASYRTDAQIEQAQKMQKDLDEKKAKVITLEDKLATASLLQDACSKKSGVPAFIIENTVPELENTANGLLDRMTDGKLMLRFSLQEDSKTTKTVQEVLRIKVSYYGIERDYETFSGAEKFMIDLSIRIALSKFLAHRAGTEMQLFVLDEGVSCADETNREEIMDALRSISGEFKKILFVTHITELKDVFNQRIIVTKDSHGSHIHVE